MTRILHVVSSLRIGSGVASVLMNCHRRMDPERVIFDYLCFKTAEHACVEEVEAMGGRVFSIEPPSLSGGWIKEADQFFSAHTNEWPVVHCHPIFAGAAVGPFARRYGARHVVQHSHTAKLSTRPLAALRNGMLLRIGRRWITDYSACSVTAARVFPWCGEDEIFLLQNTPDLDAFEYREEDRARVREKYGIAPADFVIGHVGRFSPEKNHLFLLDVFRIVLRSEPRARLLLVGDGPLFEKVRSRASALSLADRVVFAGEHPDVAAFYSAMDVFVMPSVQEGMGLAAVEAQANGLHCLLSDAVPAVTAATDLARRLTPGSSAEIWAAEVLSRFSCPRGESQRQMLTAAGFDLSLQVERLMNYYEGMA